jgi:hypothetical protein
MFCGVAGFVAHATMRQRWKRCQTGVPGKSKILVPEPFCYGASFDFP